MSVGVDYAFNPHPSISAMKGAGVRFVCRYISTLPANDANGKNLIPSECSRAGYQRPARAILATSKREKLSFALALAPAAGLPGAAVTIRRGKGNQDG
jgi:hypothetical protein